MVGEATCQLLRDMYPTSWKSSDEKGGMIPRRSGLRHNSVVNCVNLLTLDKDKVL